MSFAFLRRAQLQQMHENSTIDWDAVIASWHERPQHLWRRHSDAIYTEFLNRCLPRNRDLRLLKTDMFDEAVSAGLCPMLSNAGYSILGIDAAHRVLTTARARHQGLLLAQTDVRCLALADNSMDVIVSLSTLDHFRSFDEVIISLGELRRVLRPGGHLILTLDNLTNPVIALRSLLPIRLLNRLGLVPYFVGPTCGARRLRRELSNGGFDLLEVGTLLHCPRVIAIRVANIVDRVGGVRAKSAVMKCLGVMERLGTLPTRHFTGHYVTAHAVKNENCRGTGRCSSD